MKPEFDLSLYFIADPQFCGGRDIADVVEMAIAGGVSMVQYRDKSGDQAQIAKTAAHILEITKAHCVPLILNDYVDIAHEINACGVHLGQVDMSAVEARAILGANKIIGQTAFSEKHVCAIDASVVDYIGMGAFFETRSKVGKAVLGADKFSALAKHSPVPVVGIGGITAGNVHEVISAGANGVAVLSAIGMADDVEGMVQIFIDKITQARSE